MNIATKYFHLVCFVTFMLSYLVTSFGQSRSSISKKKVYFYIFNAKCTMYIKKRNLWFPWRSHLRYDLLSYKVSQTCIKRSALGQRKCGPIIQVTS